MIAIKGWADRKREDWEWERYNLRDLIFYVSQNLDRKRVKRATDIYSLSMDDEVTKLRHANMPKAEIILPNATRIKQ